MKDFMGFCPLRILLILIWTFVICVGAYLYSAASTDVEDKAKFSRDCYLLVDRQVYTKKECERLIFLNNADRLMAPTQVAPVPLVIPVLTR